VRTIDPVGHGFETPASSQCLQTSDKKTHRNGSSNCGFWIAECGMGSSGRPIGPVSDSLLSILLQKHDMAPRRCAEMAGVVVRISDPREAVIGHMFHSLHATSQALQPMQTEGSVRIHST